MHIWINMSNAPEPTPPPDPHAPKDLDKAFAFISKKLPKMAAQAGKPKGRIITPGTTIVGEQHSQPNRFCKVCRAACGSSQIVGDDSIKMVTCGKCQGELDKGQIALTCPDGRVAWIYSDFLAGQKQHWELSNHEMDLVELRAKAGGASLGNTPMENPEQN